MREEEILNTKSILGEKVKNPEGEDLGTISELLVDTESGSIEYGVLSFGGFLGIGEKDIAVPYKSLDLGEEFIVLNVDKKVLENAATRMERGGKKYFIY
jgi:sporulation protein YlmC with PRC-barrel domain